MKKLLSKRFDSRFLNVIPMSHDGIRFDSKAECSRYIILKEEGVSSLRAHPRFKLVPNSPYVPRSLFYESDFIYNRDGEWWVEEVKGYVTNIYKFKKYVFMSQRTPEEPSTTKEYVMLKFTEDDKARLGVDANTFKFKVIKL